MVAAGCATAPAQPLVNTGTAVKPPPIEHWIGTGRQPDAESEWAIEMKIRRDVAVGDRLGTIEYPSLGCKSDLIRLPDRGSALVASEHLTLNPETCVDGGTMVMSTNGETLDWRWFYAETDELGATATLRRASP
jgi:hypothetical protein